ncbi:DUF4160 domain-containing protein [uncultured Slackia sp.]|uniref:DUF4160 domain-containing protein n=1 Tax=uncultured Slackia sp. TaxID=665903 RepID=UPI00345C5EF9
MNCCLISRVWRRCAMPTLSMFFGIVIRMFLEKGGRHHLPHIHAYHADESAVYGLDGSLLEGRLPAKQEKLVLAWMAIHEEELRANWRLLQETGEFFRIDPLR